jgi:polar amino acid transport system substrate-binding protein
VSDLQFAGSIVWASKCARCHGGNGEGGSGGKVIGAGSNLAYYKTAKGLLNKLYTMPPSSPNSLSHPDYVNILVFLLNQNEIMQQGDIFDEAKLADILIK